MLHAGTKYDVELVRQFDAQGHERTQRAIVRHPGSVIVLPVRAQGAGGPSVLLIENFRISVEAKVLELPAGTRARGEDPLVCAHRELEEETGHRAGTMRGLGSFLTSPGLSDERMHAFVATDLVEVGQRLEVDEDIVVRPMPARQAVEWAQAGRIEDAKSALVLLWAHARGMLA